MEKDFRTEAMTCPIESEDALIMDELLNRDEKELGLKYNERYYTFTRNGQAYFIPEGNLQGNHRYINYEISEMLRWKFGGDFLPMYLLPKEVIQE